MHIWKQASLCALVLILAGGGWYGFHHRASLFGGGGEGAAAAVPGQGQQGGRRGGNFGPTLVVAEPVASDTTADRVRSVGTASVPRSVNLYPEVTAIIREVLFKAGDHVKAGQVLIQLDDADQQIAVETAQIALDAAKRTLSRAQQLAKSNTVTISALEDAQTATRKAEIDLQSARIALARRTITAPFDGVVGLTNLTTGGLVSPSTIVATLDDVSSIKVTFTIPERFSGRIADGLAVTATTDADPTLKIPGKVTAVDSRVDASARSLKVEATIDAATAAASGVRPGMSVAMALDFPGQKKLTVSALSLQWDRDGSYVWKLDGDTAKRAPVTILERQSGRVLVASDKLAEGDRVVVEGLQRLREGAKVAEFAPAGAEGGDKADGKAAGKTAAKTGAGS